MSSTAQRQHRDAPTLINFCDQQFAPLVSGALYWPDQHTLLVADLHLEKMSSFARSGQLLPPYDTRLTLARLKRDIAETHATTVICLGDSFHRDEGTRSLLDEDESCLRQLVDASNWVWLSGNHDPKPHHLGGSCQIEIEIEGLTLTHEPTRNIRGQIAGHLHPAARILTGGRSTRRPCFAYDDRLMILPAYGSSTGSMNILSQPFDKLWKTQIPNVVMLGRDRTYAVSRKRLIDG